MLASRLEALIARVRGKKPSTLNEQQANATLKQLRQDTTRFYNGPTGKAQLAWLDQFEANMLASAIKEMDHLKRSALLDQAKGLQAFRAYIDSLIDK